ncbi:MAG TPA: PPOX class F420-dependent oxidoreductase [Acidimicrobiales bacterium]|nr:PPOX class F420-dependent oxidoreductase [Acidimicrobiales bacterium]
MPRMSEEECLAFVAAAPRTAKLATVRANGAPHVAPVWVDLDGGEIVTMTREGSLKHKSLLRDPRVALCFDDETPPFSWVLVEGEAALSDDLDQLRHWATRIGGRYMGADRADEYGARNGVPGEILIRIRPTKIAGETGVAD